MQQAIHATSNPVSAQVQVPGSKAISVRAIIVAAIASGISELINLRLDNDTLSLLNTLHQFGIVTQIDHSDASCVIAGCNKRFPKQPTTVWCGESEEITALLMSICATVAGVYFFDGEKSLHQAAVSELLHTLSQQGTQFAPSDATRLPLTMISNDNLSGEAVVTTPSLSNAQLSGLLLASAYANTPMVFVLDEKRDLAPVNLTCAVMAEFGVLAQQMHTHEYLVAANQAYSGKDYVIEPDYAFAAYFFAAAAITQGEISIHTAHHITTKQADSRILALLEKMGCQIDDVNGPLTVRGPETLSGVETHLTHYGHMFAALTACAVFASSPCHFYHEGNLSAEMVNCLHQFKSTFFNLGITIDITDTRVSVNPGTIQAGTINIENNIYLGMSLAVIGLKVPGMVIENAECILLAFPDFFYELNALHKSASNPRKV